MFTRQKSHGVSRRLVNLLVASAVTVAAIPGLALSGSPAWADGDSDYSPPAPPPSIGHPSLQAIADDALAAAKYSFAVVIIDPGSTAYPRDSVEADFQAGLASLPKEKQDVYRVEAQRLLSSPIEVRQREFGRHARFSAEDVRKLGFDGLFTNVPFDKAALTGYIRDEADRIVAQARRDEEKAMELAKVYNIDLSFLEELKIKKLDFRIETVKCIDETDLEWPGNDEIFLGGLTVDHKGNTKKVSDFEVYDGFDDGETFYYLPYELFSSFDMTAAGGWGRTYTNIVMMAEEDHGGFASALQSAWEKVSAKVKAAVAKVVEELAEYLGLPEAIAKGIGEFLGWALTKFVQWIIDWFKDDLFPPVIWYLWMPAPWEWLYVHAQDWGWTNFKFPTGSLYYTGHGGKYRVNAYYQVVP